MNSNEQSAVDLLLLVLDSRAGMESLLQRGYEYHQVLGLMDAAAIQGLLTTDENGTRLTEIGRERLSTVRRSRLLEPDAWIAPDRASTFAPQGRWEVYLPRRKWRAD